MLYRILVADDEPIERAVISKTIKSYFGSQIEITQAANGREAVELFVNNECNVALLDIEMPGMNGLDAAEQIRKYSRHGVIIFLTAFDEFTYAKRAITVQALDYLLKPVADDELIYALEEAFRKVRVKESISSVIDTADETDREMLEDEKTEELSNIRMMAIKEIISEYIKQNYQYDISLQDAARAMNYAEAYFCRLFRQCFCTSFTSYLAEFRVNKAKLLLNDITINVREISDKVGYQDSNYFTKVFKRLTGLTPSKYRLNVLRKQSSINISQR